MKTQTITTADVATLINTIPNGQVFTVEFTKADGSNRVMNCRRGVTSHLTPNPKREKPAMPSNQITVFDMQKGAYRHFNTNTTRRVTACGTTFEVK